MNLLHWLVVLGFGVVGGLIGGFIGHILRTRPRDPFDSGTYCP